LLSTFVSATCVSGAQARPQFPAEDRFWSYDGSLPLCDNWRVLEDVSNRVSSREWRYTDSNLEITAFQTTGEVGYRTNGGDFIPRRYCAGRALFNDGKVREVKFNLIERGGFIGLGYGLEFCVVGLDREHAFSPECSAAGP
jgi:hypothetical protein